jgi:hypothetical protein
MEWVERRGAEETEMSGKITREQVARYKVLTKVAKHKVEIEIELYVDTEIEGDEPEYAMISEHPAIKCYDDDGFVYFEPWWDVIGDHSPEIYRELSRHLELLAEIDCYDRAQQRAESGYAQ